MSLSPPSMAFVPTSKLSTSTIHEKLHHQRKNRDYHHQHCRHGVVAVSPTTSVSSPLVVMHGILPGGRYLIGGSAAVVASRSSPPVMAAWTLGAVMIGYLLGKRGSDKNKSNSRRVSNTSKGLSLTPYDGLPHLLSPVTNENIKKEGDTPIWLNYAIARLWALFQKSTKRLTEEVLQPILDETEKPPFVKKVRLVKFIPGPRSPYLRSFRRLPSRALAEVQYSLQTLFASTSELYFEAEVSLLAGTPAGDVAPTIKIPVSVKNMDIDALCWASFSLAPYEPYLTGVQYSLLEKPKITFDLDIAGVLPVTEVPVLRDFFFKVICEELPKEFLFPNTISLDFTPELIRQGNSLVATMRIQNLGAMNREQLKKQFPEQWALYDALDLSGDGMLSGVELFAGLKDWGYTALDAAESFERLDLDGDRTVTFAEFCKMWPTLAASFVPSRYQGLLTMYVRGARNLQTPQSFLGSSTDPYVRLALVGGKDEENNDDSESRKKKKGTTTYHQEACTKCDSDTSGVGKPGCPVWNEAFELNCHEPSDEILDISVQEGGGGIASKLLSTATKSANVIGRARIPLDSLRDSPNQQLSIKLEPKGSIDIDLSYADFVDRRGTL